MSTEEDDKVTTRIPSIESFRVLAIFAVIVLHTGLVSSLSRSADRNFLVVLTGYLVWWVAVPYFFITAGYFFRQSVLKGRNPLTILRGYVSPLTWILVVWLGIYIVVPPSWPAEVFHHGLAQTFGSTGLKNIHLLLTQHITLFLEGHRPVWHLWFLPALMVGMATLAMIAIFQLEKYLVPLILSLYVLALIDEISAGYFHYTLHVVTWVGAVLLTTIGYWVGDREQPTVGMACGLIMGGCAFALLEGTIMHTMTHSSSQAIQDHIYLGGVALGLGIFLLALAKPELGRSTPFPFLARFTLGVYVSHIFVIYTLSPIFGKLHIGGPLGSVVFAVLVYAFSALLTFALAKVHITRCLVAKPTWKIFLLPVRSYRWLWKQPATP
jgi:surface polysaccharide O-acyltransferase-like enzyme